MTRESAPISPEALVEEAKALREEAEDAARSSEDRWSRLEHALAAADVRYRRRSKGAIRSVTVGASLLFLLLAVALGLGGADGQILAAIAGVALYLLCLGAAGAWQRSASQRDAEAAVDAPADLNDAAKRLLTSLARSEEEIDRARRAFFSEPAVRRRVIRPSPVARPRPVAAPRALHARVPAPRTRRPAMYSISSSAVFLQVLLAAAAGGAIAAVIVAADVPVWVAALIVAVPNTVVLGSRYWRRRWSDVFAQTRFVKKYHYMALRLGWWPPARYFILLAVAFAVSVLAGLVYTLLRH